MEPSSQSGINDVQKWVDRKIEPGSSRSYATSRVPKQENRRVEDARCVGWGDFWEILF